MYGSVSILELNTPLNSAFVGIADFELRSCRGWCDCFLAQAVGVFGCAKREQVRRPVKVVRRNCGEYRGADKALARPDRKNN